MLVYGPRHTCASKPCGLNGPGAHLCRRALCFLVHGGTCASHFVCLCIVPGREWNFGRACEPHPLSQKAARSYYDVLEPTYCASHDSLHVIVRNIESSVRCPSHTTHLPPRGTPNLYFYMVRGTCASHFMFLYGHWVHLCLSTLCVYKVIGYSCALTPCCFIGWLGTVVP